MRPVLTENSVVYGLNSNQEFPAAMIDYGPGNEYVGSTFELTSRYGPHDGYQRVVIDTDDDPVALIERGRIKHSRVTFSPRAYEMLLRMGVDIAAISRASLVQRNEETTVKVHPDADALFESVVSAGPDVSTVVAACKKSLGEDDVRARVSAAETLRGLGFTDEQVEGIELDQRRANIYARYGVASKQDDASENTNGGRQIAWYWPVSGVASREGVSEEALAKIAMVLSNASLPEDNNALRVKRIHAAAKQATGKDITETLATALSYAHRRQTQRGLQECDCRSKPDQRGHCPQPDGSTCKASAKIRGQYASRKVGKYGAKSGVRESDDGPRKYRMSPGGEKPMFAGPKKLAEMGAAWARKAYNGKSTLLPVGNKVHDNAAAAEWKKLTGKNPDWVREAVGVESKSQTICGDGTKPKDGAKKVGQRGALTLVRETYESVNDAATAFPSLAKGNTQVWLARNTLTLKEGYAAAKAAGTLPVVRTLHETHVLLGNVKEASPDVVFALLQRAKWSPNGQAKGLMERKGVDRESLTVGDVIVGRTGAWFVDTKGFTRLGT